MKTSSKQNIDCQHCGKTLSVSLSDVLKGKKFCNWDCRTEHNKSRYVLRTCRICEAQFSAPISNDRTATCSTECATQIKGESRTINCEICDHLFRVNLYRVETQGTKYCSKKCYDIAQRGQRNKSVCQTCKKEFTRKPSESCVFCSKVCYQASVLTQKVFKSCQVCQKEFSIKKSQKSRRCCSSQCSKELQRQEKERLARICEHCNKKIYLLSLAQPRKFCSKKCSAIGLRIKVDIDALKDLYIEQEKGTLEIANIVGLSPSVVERRLKENGIKLRPSVASLDFKRVPSGKNRDTDIERAIAAILGDLGIAYTQQFRLSRAFFDFYLTDYNTLIECDGTF